MRTILNILLIISGIGIIVLIGMSMLDNVLHISRIPKGLLTVLIFSGPVFVLSGLFSYTITSLEQNTSWLKMLIVWIIGLFALYLVSLPILLGGLS